MKKILRIPLLLVAMFLTSIPISAHDFEVDGIYYEIITDSTVAVTYSGDSYSAVANEYTGSVVIPETVTNSGTSYSVTSIGSDAFSGCTGLTSVAIPNSVTSIWSYAFGGCTGLTSIIIPNSVDLFDWGVFEGCTSLTEVTIGNSVDWISENAFSGCTSLKSIAIPSSVIAIDWHAFYGCSSLTEVIIPNSVTQLDGFENCTSLPSITIPNTITYISGNAFKGCTSLTEVNYYAENCTYMGSINYPVFEDCLNLKTLNIGDNVETIPNYAFNRCTGLTSVTIPNSVTSIGSSAFQGCTGLTSVTIPNSVTSIGSSAFQGCTGLTSVTIPNSVTSIGGYAFYNCSGLESLSVGERLSTIGTQVFWGCDKLVDANVATTQTTATINMSSPTQYNLGLYNNDGDKKQAENGVAKFTGLLPNHTNSNYDLALIINDIYCRIKDLSFSTKSFKVSLLGSSTSTSVSAKGTYTEGDVTILGEGINYGSKVSEYDGKNTIKINNLDPNSNYIIYYATKIKEGGVYSTSKTFTTGELVLTTQEAKPTSTTSVRLLATTNCDATEGTGFEWRRYDAPEELPSSKVSCPVVDGVLVGTLRGVKDDVYYKYRPYYTSSSGNNYYGDWILFFTGDANVYFEPEVRTYEDTQVINNSATVKGYALEGTDVITAQGFEYWKTGTTIKPASTDDRMTVNASGISMSATLANLEYNSTYKYRAFVTTAKGTIYGDEKEFSTGDDPAGIEYVEIDADEFYVNLRENPATGTAWVKILGASGNEAQYVLTSMSGAMVATGTVMLDGEWNAIELNCTAGMYLLTINDGSQVKTLRLIMK